MRYHEEPPDIWTNYYGKVYRCDHPVYRVSTLYIEGNKGLCVIQQRYNEETKVTYWGAYRPVADRQNLSAQRIQGVF